MCIRDSYPVDQLARQCDFLEVAYIMLNGDAPDEASYQTFREIITRHTPVSYTHLTLPTSDLV